MPLLFLSVPPENRSALLDALAAVVPDDVAVVTDHPNPGNIALSIGSLEDPFLAASRVGEILEAADKSAGRRLGAIATGETGWGDPPEIL